MSPEDRRKTMAKIHIAKKDLGLDDDTYRAMLVELTGKDSSKALTDQQLGKVMHHLKKRGFKPKAPAHTGSQRRQDTSAEATKVRALWLFLFELGEVRDPSEKALAAYVKRITRVEDLHWIDSDQIAQVIETLKKWAVRILPDRVGALFATLTAAGFRTINTARGAYATARQRGTYDAWLDAYTEVLRAIRRFNIRLDDAIAPRIQNAAPIGTAKNEAVQGVSAR